MAFNIRSRTGWNRLWLVLTVLWLCNVLWESLTHIPSRDDIERSYHNELQRLSPAAVAERNARYAQSREPLITQDDVARRKQEAEADYQLALKVHPERLQLYWVRYALLASLPFVLYGLIWLAVKVGSWIIRGFQTTTL